MSISFFQTFLDVPAGVVVNVAHPLIFTVSGDDGGRVTINSKFPTGCVISQRQLREGLIS
jgi:hypothetical protein